MEKFVVFSILLRTRIVPSKVSFIIILFSVIYTSLLFAVHFVVTLKNRQTFQFLKVAIQDHLSISFSFTQSHAMHVNTNLHKDINSAKLIVQKIDLIQKYWANFLNFQIKTYRWSFFIT